MDEERTVAFLTANSALSSILSMVLGDCRDLKVRQFATAPALLAYARAAPVNVLVCDLHLPGVSMTKLVHDLRQVGKARSLRIMAMTRHIDADVQAEVVRAGIDEIVVKPMSPAYIKERVLARLGQRRAAASGPTGFVPVSGGRRPDTGSPRPDRSAEIIDLSAHRGGRPPVSPQP